MTTDTIPAEATAETAPETPLATFEAAVADLRGIAASVKKAHIDWMQRHIGGSAISAILRIVSEDEAWRQSADQASLPETFTGMSLPVLTTASAYTDEGLTAVAGMIRERTAVMRQALRERLVRAARDGYIGPDNAGVQRLCTELGIEPLKQALTAQAYTTIVFSGVPANAGTRELSRLLTEWLRARGAEPVNGISIASAEVRAGDIYVNSSVA